jgi:phosphatidylserine/phosphatidylglycerophosphate/cardiolipin synthase-like enzyme
MREGEIGAMACARKVARTFALLTLLGLAACANSRLLRQQAGEIVARTQPEALTCTDTDRCAQPSVYAELLERTAQEGTSSAPVHYVNLLDRGEDSLALRLHLIRAARVSIDIQTFIFSEDDTGHVVLQELLSAARRGVRVRVLSDQLFSIDNMSLLARLARAHRNFELRLYNPTFDEARTAPLEFAAGILCCFFHFNQRMHNKLMLFDGAIGISGGRNIDDRYFDWSDEFNYRDRDVLVLGPATREMQESFEAFWAHDTAVPLSRLKDVAERIVRDDQDETGVDAARVRNPERVLAVKRRADDVEWLHREFIEDAFRVGRVAYFADLPNKPFERHKDHDRDLTRLVGELFRQARASIWMQTPYLVISRAARKTLLAQRRAHPELRIVVSTNSLASTDAFYVYAISHKYKRRYLRKYGFDIYEYKPFPGRNGVHLTRPEDFVASASGLGSGGSMGSGADRPKVRKREPAPLTRLGVRRGMHAKSIVIDGYVSLIGSHNFDPRSDDLNTESGVIVWDEPLARALQDSIAEDVRPENSWIIARRPEVPVVSEVNHAISAVSEGLPIFDLWPFRYATSYELKPECAPMYAGDADFARCHVSVGEFPEVNLSLKQIYTRIITAFGWGLMPIL